MGAKTKIDWCDATWNPVTGCLHGCEYCYARKIAHRYAGFDPGSKRGNGEWNTIQYESGAPRLGVIAGQQYRTMLNGKETGAPYPFGFTPAFHRYRLDIPQRWKKPRNIFVCSMADLFGDWVPDEWIEEVFKACDSASQHRYLFLTKNPKRYRNLQELLPFHRRPPHVAELWFGASYTGETSYIHPRICGLFSQFVSVEPLLKAPSEADCFGLAMCNDWVIVGAETGNRKDRVIPEKSWVDEIVRACYNAEVPVFMKESLRTLMGDDFRQEYPWEVKS